MDNTSFCKKVSSFLSLYIDNQLSFQEQAFVEDHLANCEECRKKYIYLKSLIKDLKSSYKLVLETEKKKQKRKIFSIREHENFEKQLYPYIDNELSAQECYNFRKYVSQSQSAQQQLKNVYIIQKELRKLYNIKQNDLKKDFSQRIINELKYEQRENSNKNVINLQKFIPSQKFAKIAILAGLVVFCGYETELLYKEYHKTPTPAPVVIIPSNNSRTDTYNTQKSFKKASKTQR